MVCKLKLANDAVIAAQKMASEARGSTSRCFSDGNMSVELCTDYCEKNYETRKGKVIVGLEGSATLNELYEIVKWVEEMLSD